MSDTVVTADLYEASWYGMHGCHLESLECEPGKDDVACLFTFSGKRIEMLRRMYTNRTADVNLWDFRKTYRYFLGATMEARQTYRRRQKEAQQRSAAEAAEGGRS